MSKKKLSKDFITQHMLFKHQGPSPIFTLVVMAGGQGFNV